MNQETAVIDPVESVEELQQQLAESMETSNQPEVLQITVEPQEAPEVMELPENINPNLVDEIAMLDPDRDDIMDEITHMDTFREYERDIAREMRGYTSDHW